jgi:cysteinyl-tRNA synthetase
MPDELPKATDHVAGIVRFIEELVERGYAYAVGGDVYFRVARDPEYGRLSRQKPDQMEEEERNPLKEDRRDFALWKANKPGEDTAWDSPWGRGRPGWHIECSVMAEEELGTEFEVHGGGLDLVFPHHENELAQSSALGHGFARIWAHNGMLEFSGEKMSKSLGNDRSIRNVIDTWGREVVLLFYMTGHWRKPIDFDDATLEQTKERLDTFRNVFVGAEPRAPEEQDRLVAILDDDFNTPDALALFHDWRARGLTGDLRVGLGLFGLGSLAEAAEAPADLVALAERRLAARAAKDFGESDRLRDEIAAAGWEVRDVADGFRLVPK